ncbi:MAG: VWA domain-containing protein [Acidobacteriia bacterium]|nr:VWA domain-containing protein [Terriglobia bacterium]
MLKDILILGLVLTARTLPAQVPAVAASEQPFTFSATAELVLLDVSVKSAMGEPVSGLTKNNFTVYEDGKLQTVSHFASEDVPVTAGLVIDTSGSMRPKRAEVITAALAFIGASNRSDEIFVVHFSDSVNLGLPAGIPFSGDLEQLRSALWRGTPQGRTALNDAIVLSLKHLEQGGRDRRTLVLVSDGGDNSSVHVEADVMRKVLESRATIYTIGIIDEDEPERNPALLRRIAQVSGGVAYFPQHLAEVTEISLQIASDIRARYTIGYVPVRSGERDSTRKITVTASAPNGHKLVVHTRTGYVVPPRHSLGGM